MNNILVNMTIPQLGQPDFQTQFEQFCIATTQNIERLMSIQYAKGNPGNSVYDEPLRIGYENGLLTPASAGFLNEIFGTSLTNLSDLLTVQQEIEQVAPTIGNQVAFKEFMTGSGDGVEININIDEETGYAYLADPYIFIDNRIKVLSRLIQEGQETYKSFTDFSVAIYGKGIYEEGQDKSDPNTWTWVFQKVEIVPKLYFDENVNEFCWKVNGQQTGVTAQGIKGNPGVNFNTLIALGTRLSEKIYFDPIQCIDEHGDRQWATCRDNGHWAYDIDGDLEYIEDPKDGDLAIVFYSEEDDYKSAFFGRVYIDAATNKPYVYIGSDQDTKHDIFECIKEYDMWKRMMEINENTEGAPRGYVLPANPTPSNSGNQDEFTNKTHMIYSENDHEDDEHYSKLHMAPVAAHGTQNVQDQPFNPQTDHIGDLQVDYNVGVQGNHVVRGNATVQGDTIMQGNMDVQGNVTTQGNVTVQGDIEARNIFMTGKKWEFEVDKPTLACMSKFKNFGYALKRSVNTTDKKFTYDIIMSGTLELNIGMLSMFRNTNELMSYPDLFAQRSMQGYGPNWQDINGAKNYDITQTNLFGAQGSSEKSKLYQVVKYEIPFEISKTITPNSSFVGGTNIFGYNTIRKTALWSRNDDCISQIVAPTNNGFDAISLRFGITGFNRFKINSTTEKCGAMFNIFEDYDEPLLTKGTYTLDQPVIVNNEIQFDPLNYMIPDDMQEIDEGEVKTLVNIFKQLNITSTTSEPLSGFAISGELYYAPLNTTINYYMDMFTRIFEMDDTIWEVDDIDNNIYDCTGLDYNISLKIVPVGCLRYNASSIYHDTPIWNAINVNNELQNETIKDIFRSTISNSNDSRTSNVGTYTSINPLISNKFIKSVSKSNINGPTGIIFKESNINSKYNISIFNQSDIAGNIEGVNIKNYNNLTTQYYDFTKNIRIFDDNIKICPNNIHDGKWKKDGESYYWESFDKIPYIFIPRCGYIGSSKVGDDVGIGVVKIGCGNLKPNSEQSSQGVPLIFGGLLVYPFSPCVIVKGTNDDLGRINDAHEDTIRPIAGVPISCGHYISRGRIMGVTNGEVGGMLSIDQSQITTNPEDWGVPKVKNNDIDILSGETSGSSGDNDSRE